MADLPETGLQAGREALRRFLAGEDPLSSMLEKIMVIATETIPGVDDASITMIVREEPRTPVFTGTRAVHLETSSDQRWPEFSTAALGKGVREVLSAPLIEGDIAKGALNLYSETH